MIQILVAIHEVVAPFNEIFYESSIAAAVVFIIWSIKINK